MDAGGMKERELQEKKTSNCEKIPYGKNPIFDITSRNYFK